MLAVTAMETSRGDSRQAISIQVPFLWQCHKRKNAILHGVRARTAATVRLAVLTTGSNEVCKARAIFLEPHCGHFSWEERVIDNEGAKLY